MPLIDATDFDAPLNDWLVWMEAHVPNEPARRYLVATFDTRKEAEALAAGRPDFVVERKSGRSKAL